MSVRVDQHSIISVTFAVPGNETLLIAAFAAGEFVEGAAQAVLSNGGKNGFIGNILGQQSSLT